MFFLIKFQIYKHLEVMLYSAASIPMLLQPQPIGQYGR